KESQEIRKELAALVERKHTLQDALGQLETQIYNFETTYLDETSEYGNIFKGWNRYALAAPLSKSVALKLEKKSNRKSVKDSDRLFSSSSISSPLSKRQSTASTANGHHPSSSSSMAQSGGMSMGGGAGPSTSYDGPSTSSNYLKDDDIYDDGMSRKKKRRE
ncbi:hypothetical protein PFISCL1PPCAC_19492, partial [Pristionchus fissidentatus]